MMGEWKMMKKIVMVACLLIAGWLLQPSMAVAALEQIPLPAGSDQLAPLEPDEPVARSTKQPAAGSQKSNALQPLGGSDNRQALSKGQPAEAQVATAGKAKAGQKKAIKKKSGKKTSKSVHNSSAKKSAKKAKKSSKKAR
ncbi:hypothetical protein [Candidatus Magnetaquicoccus inordinatus]|uniref:hypothetical protein n=1 Tax=Candidatus Magnetaquicoccus inordinatus TaxID=2496818 RepID=UPI00102D0A52|nr:hypothetical protein [Candidatus Magnetaquicoccus inordinatus]